MIFFFFFKATSVLKTRFIAKGYDSKALDFFIVEVSNRDRQTLLGDKITWGDNTEDYGLAFFTTFSSQHLAIKRIIERHWPFINDQVLGPLLSDRPHVIFRGASNLRNTIAPNVPDPPIRPTFFGDLKGYYLCGKCHACKISPPTPKVGGSLNSLQQAQESPSL